MKKVLLFTLLGMCFIPLFAQDGGLDPNMGNYFASLAGLVPLVAIVTGLIKKVISVQGFLAQLLSWAVSIMLCYLGWLVKIGIFADIAVWYVPLIYGVAIGFTANGFFNIEFVKSILKLIGLEPKKK